MHKLFLTLFAGFVFSLVDAQQRKIKGMVYDLETKFSIAYATIHMLNTKCYVDADSKGYFEIDCDHSTDILIISSVGYQTDTINLVKINLSDSFFLKRGEVILSEVVVGKFEAKVFGIVSEKMGTSSTGGSAVTRGEITTFIEIPNEIKIYRISKVFIKGRDFKAENPVRLHIYDVDSNGLPGNELLTKEVILSSKEVSNKTVIINVQDQNIFLEKPDFFVGIQWMTSIKVKMFTGPEIFETIKIKKTLTYRRNLSANNNKWYALFHSNKGGNRNMLFYPGGTPSPEDRPINMMASAEIEIFAE